MALVTEVGLAQNAGVAPADLLSSHIYLHMEHLHFFPSQLLTSFLKRL